MHDAVAHKLGVFQPRYHGEHPFLFAPFQIGLEPYYIIQRPVNILRPQLHIGPGAVAGVGVPQAHRAQRAVAHGVRPAGGHHLDGHAALVDGEPVHLMQRRTLGGGQRLIERLILRLVEGAVEVIRLPPAVAGGGENFVVVQTFGGDNGGHRVKKAQAAVPGEGGDAPGQRPLGERAGGDEQRRGLVDVRRLLMAHRDVRMRFHHAGDLCREHVPVHRQRAARRHAGGLGGLQKMAAHGAHLQLEQSRRGIRALGFQRVGANQLGKAGALVGGGKPDGLLLVQRHLHAVVRQPQRGLAPGQTRAVNGQFFHENPFISHTRSRPWRSTAVPFS